MDSVLLNKPGINFAIFRCLDIKGQTLHFILLIQKFSFNEKSTLTLNISRTLNSTDSI